MIYSLVAFKKLENISDLHGNISKNIVVSNRNVASKIYQPSKRNLHYGQVAWIRIKVRIRIRIRIY